MNCPECGIPVGDDEKFCGNCGSPLPASPSEADSGPPDQSPANQSSMDDIPTAQNPTGQDQPQEEIDNGSEQEDEPENEPQPAWSPADAETIYSEPSQPSKEFTETTPSPQPPEVQKRSTDRTLVIVIVVLVILLLCCCMAAIGIAVLVGAIDKLDSMSTIIPTLAATL